MKVFITNYNIYRADRFSGRKGKTAVAIRYGIPHNHVDLPTLVSVEATGVCIPIDNSKILLAAVYKSLDHTWIDADIIKLLSFRHKSKFACDLNVKHPLWNSRISNSSGEKLLDLFVVNKFEISAPQCPTHYSSAGNGDEFNIVVHQNIGLSCVIVSDILDSDHLPIAFHILDHVKSKNLLEPLERFTDLERFQSLACDLISLRIEINSEEEADKTASNFTVSVASVYRLSTSKVTLSNINSHDLPGLDHGLKRKHRL
jgi:hypothetical protein